MCVYIYIFFLDLNYSSVAELNEVLFTTEILALVETPTLQLSLTPFGFSCRSGISDLRLPHQNIIEQRGESTLSCLIYHR